MIPGYGRLIDKCVLSGVHRVTVLPTRSAAARKERKGKSHIIHGIFYTPLNLGPLCGTPNCIANGERRKIVRTNAINVLPAIRAVRIGRVLLVRCLWDVRAAIASAQRSINNYKRNDARPRYHFAIPGVRAVAYRREAKPGPDL